MPHIASHTILEYHSFILIASHYVDNYAFRVCTSNRGHANTNRMHLRCVESTLRAAITLVDLQQARLKHSAMQFSLQYESLSSYSPRSIAMMCGVTGISYTHVSLSLTRLSFHCSHNDNMITPHPSPTPYSVLQLAHQSSELPTHRDAEATLSPQTFSPIHFLSSLLHRSPHSAFPIRILMSPLSFSVLPLSSPLLLSLLSLSSGSPVLY